MADHLRQALAVEHGLVPESEIDAVLNLFTSFGFFLLPSDDERVVTEWARVLKPSGFAPHQLAIRKELRE